MRSLFRSRAESVEKRFPAPFIPLVDLAPDPVGGLRDGKEINVTLSDHALGDQERKIYGAVPEGAADQDDGDRLSFAGLHQTKRLEELVERAVAPRERHERASPQHEVHLAQGEIAELEAEFGGDIRVRLLFSGQDDPEADRGSAHVAGAPVGRFHHAGSSARGDHESVVTRSLARLTDDPPEFASDLVESATRHQSRRCLLLARLGAFALCVPGRFLSNVWRDDPRPAEYDDGVLNAAPLECELWLQKLQLKAQRTQFWPLQQSEILVCAEIRRAVEDPLDSSRVVFGWWQHGSPRRQNGSVRFIPPRQFVRARAEAREHGSFAHSGSLAGAAASRYLPDMALRLIELVLPRAHAEKLGESFDQSSFEVHGMWSEDLDDEKKLVRVLASAGGTEAVLDEFDKRFSWLEDYRIILLPAEATLPRPKEAPAVDEPKNVVQRINREELYANVLETARPTRVFAIMVALSSVVAAVGLVRDSSVIVLSAMVIAPLLGPNVALALATTLGDRELAVTSIRTAVVGFTMAVSLAVLYGLVLHVDPAASEVVSRTRVDLGDVVLALAAGTAAALTITSGMSGALIGVMVAVALLPPTIVTGMLIGGGYFREALGAAELLAINLVCLTLAAIVTFLVQGIRPTSWWEAEAACKATVRALVAGGLLLVVLIVLVLLRIA